MGEFNPLQVYATIAGIRYTAGLVGGLVASHLEKKAELTGNNSNARRNMAVVTGVMDGMRIPLEVILAGENANPMESTVRMSLEYMSSLAGIYTPKIVQYFKK